MRWLHEIGDHVGLTGRLPQQGAHSLRPERVIGWFNYLHLAQIGRHPEQLN